MTRAMVIVVAVLGAAACAQQGPAGPSTTAAGGEAYATDVRIDPSIGQGGRPLSTTLTGAAEVPGPGDPDGSGTAEVTLNPGQGEVCFTLTVSGIDPATAAHIHEGPIGVAGGVVVPLSPPPTGGSSTACVAADRELVRAIMNNPDAYYVNVHNAAFPAGAVRGQLAK